MKEEQIKIELLLRSFKVFTINKTKNREVIWFVLLELEINGHIKTIDIVIIDKNSIDIFLEYS